MVQDTIYKIILIIWLCVCAWLDWRYGEVSNWLTIPPMVAAGVYVLINGGNAPWIFIGAVLAVFVLFYLGSIGGADAKILSTLAGFWPAALVGSVLEQGIWGLVILLRKGRKANFHAIPSYAAGTVISLIISII